MSENKIQNTPISNCVFFSSKVFKDSRGIFTEMYRKDVFKDVYGIDTNFVQDNIVTSKYGVIRGLHFQKNKFAQAKLIRVLKGKILDVVLDIRQNSPTFGKTFSIELSAKNKRLLYIPKGLAHGYSTLEDQTIVFYKCDALYSPKYEGGINCFDKKLGIDWKIPSDKIILSEKDFNWPNFEKWKEKRK